MQRTEKSDFTGRNQDEQKVLSELKNFHEKYIDAFGVNWNAHYIVTLQRQNLSRLLHYDKLYQQIVGVPGVIIEFGVQWGSTLAQLISLRGIHEPYNHRRHIYGFDTFEGFANTSSEKDGSHLSDGDYSVTSGYESDLEALLELQEANAPIAHKKKFSLVKGDVSKTVHTWIDENPHAIVAMAVFDLDIYRPTRDALEAILPRLTKGSVLVFDELNCAQFPGETEAVREVLTTNGIRLRHNPHQPDSAWAVWGD